MSIFWGSDIQHGGEKEHYCIVYLKFPNREALKCFPPVIFAWKLFLTLYTIITTGVITHLGPDILEWEVKWALGSITMNKASGGDGISVKLFQILKDDSVKVLHSICQQIGKTQQCHRTGKGQFSFQSQRKAMPKSAKTTIQFHSSHMSAKECSKFSQLGSNSMWNVNLQMCKLDLEKVEEPEIKFPTSVGSSKKWKSSRNHLLLLYWLCESLCVDHNKLWKTLKEMGILDHLTCLLKNLYVRQEATVRTGHGTTD